jgi:molybdopterin converting factor small subunit
MITVLFPAFSSDVKPVGVASSRGRRGQLRHGVGSSIDGEECGTVSRLASPVKEGTEIEVLPSAAGG